MTGEPNAGTTGEWWLGVKPDSRFEPLIDNPFSERDSFFMGVIPYLNGRGAGSDDLISDLVRTDLSNLAQALTILFQLNHEVVLKEMMPDHLYAVIHDVGTTIDHVGREIIGPLDFYLTLVREVASQIELDHFALPAGPMVTPDGEAVFPSVQVVEALRQYDPDMAGVTIGKSYFTPSGRSDYRGCLELFQPALRTGVSPQAYEASLARLENLSDAGSQDTIEPPICHVSIQADELDTVHEMHQVASEDTSGLMKVYLDEVMENPNDGSTLTKILMRSTAEAETWNRILEVNHHINDR